MLNVFFQKARDNDKLIQKISQLSKYIMRNYNGKYEKAIYENTLSIYLQIADKDIVKVKDCESLFKEYLQKFGNEIKEEERAKYESWISQLRETKSASKYCK